jgi:hypothetical protein
MPIRLLLWRSKSALVAFVLLTLAALCFGQPVPDRRPLPQPPGETAEPPLAVGQIEQWRAEQGAADDVLFRRLRDRIDQRIEQKVADGFEEAAGDTKKGLGSIIAVACVALVKKLVAALIVAAIVSVLWSYWWIAGVLLLAVAAVGYVAGSIGGSRAAKG